MASRRVRGHWRLDRHRPGPLVLSPHPFLAVSIWRFDDETFRVRSFVLPGGVSAPARWPASSTRFGARAAIGPSAIGALRQTTNDRADFHQDERPELLRRSSSRSARVCAAPVFVQPLTGRPRRYAVTETFMSVSVTWWVVLTEITPARWPT